MTRSTLGIPPARGLAGQALHVVATGALTLP